MVNLYNNPNDIFEEDENIIQIDQVLPPTMEGMPEGYENKLTTLNKALADKKYIMPGSPEFYRSASQFNDFFGKDVPNFISEKGFDKISASAALGS